MGTLTSLLNLAEATLNNNQSAIDIVAKNIANQNTAGYVRQIATWTSGDSVSINGTAETIGATVAGKSQRDRILEQSVQQQTQSSSEASTRLSVLQNIEKVFTLTSAGGDASGISSALSTFFQSFSALEASPSDPATRQSVLSAMQTLAGTFNSASTELSTQKKALDSQIGSVVGQVNSLIASIALLNQKISSTTPNGDAGALEDQRQAQVLQLSSLIGLNQQSTESNGLNLMTANGTLLVGGSQAYPLVTSNSNGQTSILSNSQIGNTDITFSVSGGQLGGLLKVRDGDLLSTQNSLDQIAYAIAVAVNTQNAAGLDANGAVGGAIFNIPGTVAGTASSISVALSNASGIAAAAPSEGVGGTTNAASLAALASKPIVGGQTATASFASFLASLGSTVATAMAQEGTQAAILTQVTSQRNALSAVSLDEEAASLTQYQRSYQAAAKVYSIVNQLMAAAINLGTETTVS